MNPPRPEPSEAALQANPGNFSRVASGGSFVVANVPSGTAPDVFPPCKITDFEAVPVDNAKEFLLSWTAPGNDCNVGTGQCEILLLAQTYLFLRSYILLRFLKI